ncbi:restriction endonuclease subunit S [Acinetobacter indicus]|nr:restriction endonuclease subunit S [Acinetobacter indicus]QIC74677.1 restriction endonuclease subunit S [Acinetobacter indicus]
MATPKLRFKEFDGDWSESKLKDCIDSIDSGWSPQCESYPADENEWAVLKTTSVDWDGFKANFNKKLPSNLEARFEIEVKPNDILVTRAGPTERVGVVAVVPHNVRSKLMISDKLIRLKANNENNPEFLGISLSSVKCQNQLQSKTSGLAKSQTNISQKILCDVSLMTPAKAEQTKIASFLSNVDEKISQLTQKHELLSQYKQGMMQKLFSKQIRFKADDGSEFGEWENISVKEIFDVTRGQVLAVSNTVSVADADYKYPVFSSQTKQKGLMGFYKKYLFEDALTWTTDGANAGDVNFRKGKFYCTNVCGVLLSKKGYANLCIAEILNKVTHKYVSYVGNPKLMNNVMSEIPITIPINLEEQTKIANFLSAIDQKIEVVAEQIEQAKIWKKGLLQQMFV